MKSEFEKNAYIYEIQFWSNINLYYIYIKNNLHCYISDSSRTFLSLAI